MGGEPLVIEDASSPGTPTALENSVRVARIGLRAALFCVVAFWVASLPIVLGLIIFNAQFILGMIGLASALVFLKDRAPSQSILRILDIVLAGLALAIFGYVATLFYPIYLFAVIKPPQATWLAFIMILLVLEATRRKTGPILPLLVIILTFFFAFIGPNLPLSFQTRPLNLMAQISKYALSEIAMVGRVMEIVGLVVIPFIVFGFLLNAFGGGAFFTGLATLLVGKFRGGPAKISVVGSAAFGMVSGSAVANVVTVGAVSIPLMARTGYRRHVAAGIEAVTSTGGQLMPPIMGASAFLMAEFLEIPYSEIVVAAILPALFFYVALFLAVDFEARRLNIPPSSPETLGLTDGDSWLKGAPYLIPVAVLLYLLFVERRTAGYASLYTVIALMAVHMLWPSLAFLRNGRRTIMAYFNIIWRALWGRFKRLVTATLDCMEASTEIILLAATAGLIMGLLLKTGFAGNITLQMVILSQGKIAILLVLTALLGIILGMGMPTVGVYILLALLAAPALIELNIEPLAAHLYVLYFGMLSMITPPVAIASFAAASVAGTNPWKTSFASVRIGAGVYLVPIAFVTQPELLFIGDIGDTAIAATRLLVATSLFTMVFIGHGMRNMKLPFRVISAPVAVACIMPLGGPLDTYLWVALGLGAILLISFFIPRQNV